MKGGFIMTANQINYQRHLEESRHNRVSEAEAQRAAIAALQETRRHSQASVGETYRHNLAWESDQATKNAINQNHFALSLAEQQRASMAQEAVGWYNASTNRINANTQIAHVGNQYQVGYMNAQTGYTNAQTAKRQAGTSQYQAETQRGSAKAQSAAAIEQAAAATSQAASAAARATTSQYSAETDRGKMIMQLVLPTVSRALKTVLNDGKGKGNINANDF